MATDAQIEANRRNASKSTGPRTAEGKARASRNATKHGLTSRLPVLPDEDPAQFRQFQVQVVEELRPVGSVETAVVTRIAGLQWRLARIPGLEAAALAAEGTEAGLFGAALGDVLMVDAGAAWGRVTTMLERLHRYEASLQRCLLRLLRELRTLQQERERREAAAVDARPDQPRPQRRPAPATPEESDDEAPPWLMAGDRPHGDTGGAHDGARNGANPPAAPPRQGDGAVVW